MRTITSIFIYSLFLFMLIFCGQSFAGIEIEKILFQKAYQSSIYDDSELVDDGGTMFVYVRNTDSVARTVTELKINGTDADTLVSNETLLFWRYWPETIPAGEVAAITVKAFDSPIADNTSVTVFVKSSSNATDSMTTTLKEQKLKLGSVMASQDMKTLYLFVRNTDSSAYTIDDIYINGAISSGNITHVSGSTTINPGWAYPIKVSYASAIPELKHLSICISATKSVGGSYNIGAPLRLVRPRYEVGNWSSSLPEPGNEDHLAHAKTWGLTHNTGHDNWTNIQNMFDDYAIAGLTLDTSYNSRFYNQGLDRMTAYFIDDEPDHSADPVGPLLTESMDCWRVDPTHPTYINLCKNHRFAQYSHITDIVGMDHYIMYAPNILGGTNGGDFEEVLEYMDILKLNTEPRMMWPWPQLLAPGTWNNNPEPWGINLQFWQHIMSGAKGHNWFKYGPGWESTYTSRMSEVQQVSWELSLIEGVVLYSEQADLATASTSNVEARVLVGEEAMVLIIVNMNYDKWRNWPWEHWKYDINSSSGYVDVVCPSWLSIQQIKQATSSGWANVSYSFPNSTTARINFDIKHDSMVVLLGKNDTTAPSTPQNLRVSGVDGSNATIAWEKSFDNYGINVYLVYKNGTYVGTTKGPVYTGTAGSGDYFQVYACDAVWNSSPSSNIVYIP